MYRRVLTRHPFLTNAITTMVVVGAGDVTAQQIENRHRNNHYRTLSSSSSSSSTSSSSSASTSPSSSPSFSPLTQFSNWDSRRTAIMSSWGSVFGSTFYLWFRYLDSNFPQLAVKTPRAIGAKVLATWVFAIPVNIGFFTYTTSMEHFLPVAQTNADSSSGKGAGASAFSRRAIESSAASSSSSSSSSQLFLAASSSSYHTSSRFCSCGSCSQLPPHAFNTDWSASGLSAVDCPSSIFSSWPSFADFRKALVARMASLLQKLDAEGEIPTLHDTLDHFAVTLRTSNSMQMANTFPESASNNSPASSFASSSPPSPPSVPSPPHPSSSASLDEKILLKLESRLPTVLKNSALVWMPANTINWMLISPQYRVVFSSWISVLWNCYLSLMQHESSEHDAKRIEQVKQE